ncbi:MAG: hypothetical protein LBS44_01920, partial [Deltaproteobacteria bacterium]|nr:hypothetical protein [Deltaproteobacteria bacterium]
FKPSSKARLTVSLKDPQGRPVAGRVSLALVDQGILSLTNFTVPDPLNFFTRSRSLSTLVYDLYHLFLPPEPEGLPFLTPGGDGSPGRDTLFSPFKRNQEILSLFLGTIDVPDNGSTEVELDVPEYSGQARLALSAESFDLFGTYSTTVKVSRELTLEPTLPLALAPGDSFVSTVRIFLAEESNKPNLANKVNINIEPFGPLSIQKITDENGVAKKLPFIPKLKPGQAQTIKVYLTASPSEEGPPSGPKNVVGPAGLKFLTAYGDQSFSQTVSTVVRPPFPRTSISESRQLQQDRTTLTIDYGSFLPGTAEASLSLAAGPAVEAARAAVFLQEYPYGCLEQTISRAWSYLATLEMAAHSLTQSEAQSDQNPGRPWPGQVEMALDDTIKRIATMKTFQGGFSSWPSAEARPWEWGSAYAVHFLVEADRLLELPQNLKDHGLRYLRSLLRHSSSQSDQEYFLNTQAYALYVLALYGDKEYGFFNYLLNRKDGLSNTGLIFLAGAQALMDGRPEALIELEKKHPELTKINNQGFYLESEVGNTALLLNAWTGVDPLNPRTADLAVLVAEQGRKGRWTNTQENGLAIMSLGAFMRKTGGSEPYQASILDLNEQILAQGGELDVIKIDKEHLKALPDHQVSVRLTGNGRPWLNLSVTGVPTTPLKAESKVLSLVKTWKTSQSTEPFPVGQAVGPGQPTAPSTEATADAPQKLTVSRGELIEVELTVKAEQATREVVVADLLPGGFELVSQIKAQNDTDSSGYSQNADSSGDDDDDDDYGDNYSDDYSDESDDYDRGHQAGRNQTHLELREDRVIAVLPSLYGTAKLRYQLRAVTAGEFILPPTTAEGMYQPERRAVLASARVTVLE